MTAGGRANPVTTGDGLVAVVAGAAVAARVVFEGACPMSQAVNNAPRSTQLRKNMPDDLNLSNIAPSPFAIPWQYKWLS